VWKRSVRMLAIGVVVGNSFSSPLLLISSCRLSPVFPFCPCVPKDATLEDHASQSVTNTPEPADERGEERSDELKVVSYIAIRYTIVCTFVATLLPSLVPSLPLTWWASPYFLRLLFTEYGGYVTLRRFRHEHTVEYHQRAETAYTHEEEKVLQ